jgi:diguanylate cyclase (GGDEF)-like protein
VRFGGDEFCVVLANATEEETVRTYCQRVKTLLAECCPDVTISMGVTQTGPNQYEDADTLLRHADTCMYSQKNSNKNGHQKVGADKTDVCS